MIRQIKFRAFDRTSKKDGVMVQWSELQKFPVEAVFINAPFEITMMQFTGSTSYNGIEIYEDDKVVSEYDELGSDIPVNFEGVVKFIGSGFYVINDELQLMFPVFQEIARWKITGNVHEK